MKATKLLSTLLLLFVSIFLVACNDDEGTEKTSKKEKAETVKTFLLYSETSTSEDYGSTGDLYVKTFTSESEKIASDVLNDQYEYNASNNTVYFLTIDNDLYQYKKGKDKEKLASNVSYFSSTLSEEYIYYQNDEDDLYVINPAKESEKIASSVNQIDMIKSDLYYLNYDGDLNVYNIKSRQEKSIASDISYFELLNKDGDLFYTNDDLMLFYKKADKDTIRISSKEVNESFVTKVDDGFVYIAYEDDDQILYKSKLDGSETKKIASDVISYSMSNDNIVYLTFDDNLFMKKADEDSATKLASDVIYYYIDGKNIFFQDTDSKVFKIGKDGKKSEQATDVEKIRITNDSALVYENSKSELFIADKKVATEVDGFALFANNIAYATTDDKLHFIENLGEPIIIEEDLSKYSVVTYQNEVIFSNYLTFDDISGEWKVYLDGDYGYISISKEGIITNRYTNSTTAMELMSSNYNSMEIMIDGEYGSIEKTDDDLILTDDYNTLYLERASLKEIADLNKESEDLSESENNDADNNGGGVTAIAATLDTVPYPGSINTVESAREQIETLIYDYLNLYVALNTYDLDSTVYNESSFYKTQYDYMTSLYERDIMLEVNDYSYVDLKQVSDKEFSATTKEEYTIYNADGSDKVATQTSTYTIQLINGEFYITDLSVK